MKKILRIILIVSILLFFVLSTYKVFATTVSKDGEIAPTVGDVTAVGVVVTGDITGTGEIDVTDLSTIQEEIVETIELKGTYKKAADMDKNGEIDVVDLSQLQEYIVNN